MKSVGAHEVKNHFSAFLDRVARGESITITCYGTPIARLVPFPSAPDQAKRVAAIERINTNLQ